MIEFYEVTLVLFNDDNYNPKFIYNNLPQSKALTIEFVEQGYETSIKPIFEDDNT